MGAKAKKSWVQVAAILLGLTMGGKHLLSAFYSILGGNLIGALYYIGYGVIVFAICFVIGEWLHRAMNNADRKPSNEKTKSG